MKKQIYIAGPMSGLPEFNFPAFFRAAARLAKQGWHVWNPANKDVEKQLTGDTFAKGDNLAAINEGFDFRTAFLWDVTKIINGDAIYLLKGWEHSPGATAEHAVARAMQKHFPHYRILYEAMEERSYAA